MKDSLQQLKIDLEQLESLLTRENLLSFSPEERRFLIEESGKIGRRLDSVADSFLTVGLLGGTGVGKSTLMNALAESEIALASHRRPQTDRVLIYRHVEAELPPSLRAAKAPWIEHTHEVESIRQIQLCDLPDFDSLEGEHRRHVLQFLEHLDVLVWISSPEKYADARFYDFLKEVPKAAQNFYFVLNKVDLFFLDEGMEKGYERLSKVIAGFQSHLAENGVSQPLIYAISARDAAMPDSPLSPWNQFGLFRRQIFQNRDIKEVLAIKTANLDVEVQKLFSALDKEVLNLNSLRQIVQDLIDDLEGDRREWTRVGGGTLGNWLSEHFDQRAFARQASPFYLVGPGYILAVLIQEWQKLGRVSGEESPVAGLFKDDGPLSSLKLGIERLENRLAYKVLHRGLPAVFVEEAHGMLDPESRWEEMREKMRQYAQMRVTSGIAPSRGFRVIQYGVYSVISAFFVFAIGGEAGWAALLREPGAQTLVRLISHIINTIFSPVGLAALGSYLLLQIFLGFRFYGRYKKFLQRRTQKFIDSLRLELTKLWEEELNAIIGRLEEYGRELESRLSAIALLHEERKKD